MICRVCQSRAVTRVAGYQPYPDYACEVYDCYECRCRFVPHDEGAHRMLHRCRAGGYASHSSLAQAVADAIDLGRPGEARRLLRRIPKARWVIDGLERRHPPGARVVEVGCSEGALAGYLKARGFDVLGIDVAEDAIRAARQRFGDRFVTSDDPRIEGLNSVDAICHTGTIGCVADPIGMTRRWLRMLRSGGDLIFNAPDVRAARHCGQIWVHSTAPPDLVTLFPPQFWQRFHDLAVVRVKLHRGTSWARVRGFIEWVRGQAGPAGSSVPLFADQEDLAPQRKRPAAWPYEAVYSMARASAAVTQVGKLLPVGPAEFGVHVRMTRR